MTEDEVRTTLQGFDGADGMEQWIAARLWQVWRSSPSKYGTPSVGMKLHSRYGGVSGPACLAP
jgi:hypothetical protein